MKKRKKVIYILIVFMLFLFIFIFFNKYNNIQDNKNIKEKEIEKSISTINTKGIEWGEKKDVVMKLVSSAENSSLDWQKQYEYIENINDGRGYTAGIIGFTTKNGDLLDVVNWYTKLSPNNKLTKFISALENVKGSDNEYGLGEEFVKTWKDSALDKNFRDSQDLIRDRDYFTPAVHLAKGDGLSPLGQFIYYDAVVMHGVETEENNGEYDGFLYIREKAREKANTPLDGGDEEKYLQEFLKAREIVMKQEEAHKDISRIIAQRKFLKEKNYNLELPLEWIMYGERFIVKK